MWNLSTSRGGEHPAFAVGGEGEAGADVADAHRLGNASVTPDDLRKFDSSTDEPSRIVLGERPSPSNLSVSPGS